MHSKHIYIIVQTENKKPAIQIDTQKDVARVF